MAEKVFLSYASVDRDIADQAQDKLKKVGLLGENYIIVDPHKEIQYGDNAREVIRNQISLSTSVVIVASPSSAKSQWVNYEAGMASALGKPIILIGHGAGNTQFFNNLENVTSIDIDEV